MRILVVCQHFYPENFQITDICRQLVLNGHSVTVLAGLPNYPLGIVPEEYRHGQRRREKIDGIDVIRCFEVGRKKGLLHLALNYASFTLSSCWKSFSIADEYDVIYSYQLSPVLMALPAALIKMRLKKPLFLYCCDLWPESLKIILYGRRQSLLFRIFFSLMKQVSKAIYRQADVLAVQSRTFLSYFQIQHDISPEKLCYLPQFGEESYLEKDFRRSDAPYSSDFPHFSGLSDPNTSGSLRNDGSGSRSSNDADSSRTNDSGSPRNDDSSSLSSDVPASSSAPKPKDRTINFIFLGNIGIAQNIDCILHAAALIKSASSSLPAPLSPEKDTPPEAAAQIPPFAIHFVGDGSWLKDARSLTESLNLTDTIYFHGRHPVEEMPDFYRMADACLLTLAGDSLVGSTVPSKLQGYMAAGKPVIAAINGSAQEIIAESGCGLYTSAGNAEGLAQIMMDFMQNPSLYSQCGEKGRAYFRHHFTKTAHIKALERILEGLTQK